MNVVEKEINYWITVGSVSYVNNVETLLASSMNLSWESDIHAGAGFVTLPPHLFGEMAKTEEGCMKIYIYILYFIIVI